MAVNERTVKNKRNASGELTGRSGTVYDVNIKYRSGGQSKTYSKKGFPNRKTALEHEAAMRAKLVNPAYTPPTSAQAKLTLREYINEWVETHGQANLRPSTFASYKSTIKNHIIPHLGDVPLGQITPAMLDKLFAELAAQGLSQSSVRYVHRILGVSLEHARKYHYIESNPARDIITRFGRQGKTPDPYTVEQMKALLSHVLGTPWELVIVLGGLYGLRLSEIIGLRWHNVDLEKKTFGVVEQLPYGLPKGTTEIMEMAPVKSSERVLPITEATLPYFRRQRELQERQRGLLRGGDGAYIENDLVIAKPDGSPKRREVVSGDFGQLLKQLQLPHIRFHDLRHSAATNMHQLTGDFFTVGQILGHSLKGIGAQLSLPIQMNTVTAQYIDVRLDRKEVVLTTYHKTVLKESR